ncbi:MAG TPA: hypothetical protein DGG94_13710 [Micromonosporaceae bacterium]|nr:hypothetical protein [Micromonosporaceae bacterium]HCU50832.1 hypothetical protein [Micromonosporaceae bacterium]
MQGFDMVVRGYDREQVDAWVQNPVGKPDFTVVLRGYDRHQVDAFLQWAVTELRGLGR